MESTSVSFMVAGNPPIPTVHVTIPAYGDGPMLREAVESVLRQEDAHWLLSISDDGPENADLRAWVDSLHDERIDYSRNGTRLGLNRNFQRCLELARAPYVVVMGADDRMLPNYVEVVCRAALAHPQACWIQPRVRVIGGSGQPTTTLADRVKARIAPDLASGLDVLGGEALATSLLNGVWMYFPAVAFRSDAVLAHGFRQGYDVVLDLDLYLRMILDGATAVYPIDVAFEYRRHAASVSSSELLTGARFAEDRAFFSEVRATLRLHGWKRAARAAALRPSSRLHALASLPRVRDASSLKGLLLHAFGS